MKTTITLAALLVTAAIGLATPATAEEALSVIQGGAQPLGQGTAYAWVAVDGNGTARSIGVSFSETALTNLPARERVLLLDLPAPARRAGYDHVGVNWNPHGHEPPEIYGLPHFDVHFYRISLAQQMAILPSDPHFMAKLEKAPPAVLLPAGYVMAPHGVPMMGAHWVNPASPEFHGQAFTHTLIFGSYDGAVTFVEPMVTLAQLEKRTTVSTPVPAPARFTGMMPTQYSVTWDATAHEYGVSLDDLAKARGSAPGPR